MRRALFATLAAVVLAGSVASVAHTAPPGSKAGSARMLQAEEYTWRNAAIGGGGFVPGIVFSEAEPDLIYARTDIGGAYRWSQSTQSWTPMLDWVGMDNWGWNGVSSLAADPVDADRVYVAAGMYTNDWDPNNGAILRSTDRGETWQAAQLPFKLGGNMPGRGAGERLAVDPNANNVVYFGAPEGNGLWRSTNFGASWSRVTSFPNPGDWAQEPGDPYLGHRPGVVWVAFDPTDSGGGPSQGIYVGVADLQNTVYRSTDGGSSWSRIAGQPTGFMAQQGVVDHRDGTLYIATSTTMGPYDGDAGDVWKFDPADGSWTRISPVPSDNEDNYYGYSGLTIDRQDPDTLMVATQISWWPDVIFFRSTDGGQSWTQIWDWANYPDRTRRYTMDISEHPWLTFGVPSEPPVDSPKLGWMTQALRIDPFDSDRMMYGTGATIYGTTQLTNWDAGQTFTIRPMIRGLEETVPLDLISPPTGARLLAAIGDIGGMRWTDLDQVPSTIFTSPVHTTGRSIDYAELNPAVIVRTGDFDPAERPNDRHVAFSTDGGQNWFQPGSEPGGVSLGGTVAAAADGSRFVWAPGDDGQQVVRSEGFGNNWQQASGIPSGARVGADRVNSNTFYGFANGTFYRSTNGGATFSAGAGGFASFAKFKAVPGLEGHIWLADDNGLHRSTDGGSSFTQIGGISQAWTVGFGAAAPNHDHPAVYITGTVGSTTGVFRSDDAGASWIRINDDDHQWGLFNESITGDPRTWGRVYIGTNGRGLIYGDSSGTPPTTPPPTTPPPTTPPPTTPPPTTPPPTTPPPGGCTAVYQSVGQWSGGFQAGVRVTNTGSSTTSGWQVEWTFDDGQQISQLWGGDWEQDGPDVTVTNVSYNGSIASGQSIEFGFLGSWSGTNGSPGQVSCTTS